MMLYAVASLRCFDESDEEYFSAEKVFSTEEAANAYIKEQVNDIVTGKNKEDHELFYGENEEFADNVYAHENYITDECHRFMWEVSPVELDCLAELKVYCQLRDSYQEEDVRSVLEDELEYCDAAEKLGYHSIDDIPEDVYDEMVSRYSKYVSDCSNWNELAQDAIRDVLHEEMENQNISDDED